MIAPSSNCKARFIVPSLPPYACIAAAFWQHFTQADVADWVCDARRRTLSLVNDLDDEQLLGPRLATVNPLLWEMGHVAWFQERWVLRHSAQRQPLRADADALYDSAAIPHNIRWDLPLLRRTEVLRYMGQVQEQVLERLASPRSEPDIYFHLLALFHEDMHVEAFLMNRQAWSYPRPDWPVQAAAEPETADECSGDVTFAGGTFWLGAASTEPFVFDNEKWAYPVEVKPFALARTPVTQAQFAAFVDAGGYERSDWWSGEGWRWRQEANARHPVYWQRSGPGQWLRRDFDRWLPLEPHRPVINIAWYEADAYCRWAGRRLPTEAEWEVAAALPDTTSQSYAQPKRRFPWGDRWPRPEQANLDGVQLGCVDVGACAAGDSTGGCRQMIGNVWEWTASDFAPFPGFEPDPYREYSQPWFHTHKVLRGGCWATRGRLIRNTWRNFYQPNRRDVWAGFRTCALGV